MTSGTVLSHATSSHLQKNKERYEPIERYTYTVDGVGYKDSRLAWYFKRVGSEGEASEYTNAQFRIGGSIPVHYGPLHPHHAFFR